MRNHEKTNTWATRKINERYEISKTGGVRECDKHFEHDMQLHIKSQNKITNKAHCSRYDSDKLLVFTSNESINISLTNKEIATFDNKVTLLNILKINSFRRVSQ